MGWFAKLFSIDVASPIKAIGDVIDELHTSEDEKLQAKAVIEKLQQHPAELQAAINKIEAGHRSIFVAGWRPFIGWICGTSLGFYFIPQYALAAYLWAVQILSQETLPVTFPPFPANPDGLLELVLALLGMATIRTADKLTGKAR